MSVADGPMSWNNMTQEDKEAGKGMRGTNNFAESSFAQTKNEKHKFGTCLSILNAGAVGAMKTSGMMARVLSGGNEEELGYWHVLDKCMKEILVVYSERESDRVKRDFNRAVKAYMIHKD